MRNLFSVPVLALVLSSCAPAGDSANAGLDISLPPSAPATDQNFVSQSVVGADTPPDEFASVGEIQPGANSPLYGAESACEDTRRLYFPAGGPTATAAGPRFERSPDSPFEQSFTTWVETYENADQAQRVINLLKEPQAAFCLRRLLEPVLVNVGGENLSRPNIKMEPVEAFTGDRSAGVRLTSTGFFERQAITPNVELIARQADRSVIYGLFTKTDGRISSELQTAVMKRLAINATEAATVASETPTPAG